MTNLQKILFGIYGSVLVFCAFLMIYSDSLSSLAARDNLIGVASDGFKLALGAIVGTVSTMIGKA